MKRREFLKLVGAAMVAPSLPEPANSHLTTREAVDIVTAMLHDLPRDIMGRTRSAYWEIGENTPYITYNDIKFYHTTKLDILP
jgi:hypothetical protein